MYCINKKKQKTVFEVDDKAYPNKKTKKNKPALLSLYWLGGWIPS